MVTCLLGCKPCYEPGAGAPNRCSANLEEMKDPSPSLLMSSLACLHSQKSKYWQIYGAICVWLQTNKNEQQVKTEAIQSSWFFLLWKSLSKYFWNSLYYIFSNSQSIIVPIPSLGGPCNAWLLGYSKHMVVCRLIYKLSSDLNLCYHLAFSFFLFKQWWNRKNRYLFYFNHFNHTEWWHEAYS